MDIESNGKLTEQTVEADEVKEDIADATIVSNARGQPDRRLVRYPNYYV